MSKEELSASESVIMKAIWDAGEDISIPDLTEVLRVHHGKDYKRTTIVTFLLRLSDKGFVTTYRKGKLSYAHAEKSEEEYRHKLAMNQTEFWFHGKPSHFISALSKSEGISKEEADEIRRILDELDN